MRRAAWRSGLLSGIFLSFGLPPCVFGATIAVPAQQSSIQSAIDAAANGDTITVAPGSYNEDLDFKGKLVAVVGTGGAAQTFLTGAGGPYVITFQNHETRSSSVSGFTIRNATGKAGQIVYSYYSAPSLTDNVFEPGDGVAVFAWHSSLLLERSQVRGAQCKTNTTFSSFGAVGYTSLSNPVIKDNAFINNGCPALNIALPEGYSADISNNTFVYNDTGIYIDARVDSHTILLRNNILLQNRVGIFTDFLSLAINTPTIQNNLSYSNSYNYQGVLDQAGLNGNLSVDPGLGGINVGDFHPDAASPVIDSGTNSAVDAGELDVYGKQRIRAANSSSAVVDLGAAEYIGVPPTTAFAASRTYMPAGTPITLTWNSTRADSCAASGAWSGTLATSGSAQVTPPAGDSTFTLACSNSAASRGQQIKVTAVPPPAIQLSAVASPVSASAEYIISWSTTNADSCTKSGAWSGDGGTNGQLLLDLTPGTYTYTLSCTGFGGTASKSISIKVTASTLPQIVMNLSQNDVPLGGTTVLSWSTTNVTSCTGSGRWNGVVALSGSLVLSAPAVDLYGYTLTCTGPGGTISTSRLYTVYAPTMAPYVSSQFSIPSPNVRALALPGSGGPNTGGLDNHGYAYDRDFVNGEIAWSGQVFQIGDYLNAASIANATVALPAMKLAGLSFLATGASGDQLNKTLVVTYTDGTSATYTQSFSDWGAPKKFSGEAIAKSAAYRVTPAGLMQAGSWNIYGYHMPLDPSKTVKSLTLPKTRNVIVLAINLNAPPQSITQTLQTNVYGLAVAGSPAPSGGFDAHGYAYDGSALPPSLTSNGSVFTFGPVDVPSGVTKRTIPLQAGKTLSITILAAAVNGAQTNQPFTVTYDDYSTTVFNQSVSEWGKSQGYPGESTAITLANRITPSGTKQPGNWRIYSYTFTPDPARIMRSLTLPNTRNVIVLGVGQAIIN